MQLPSGQRRRFSMAKGSPAGASEEMAGRISAPQRGQYLTQAGTRSRQAEQATFLGSKPQFSHSKFIFQSHPPLKAAFPLINGLLEPGPVAGQALWPAGLNLGGCK